ncbi:hypothetical protein F8M41_013174 [Gigaspora margarita]|uniref:Uncharacterized protein n=1 Tax=Gigaspora margarita TaxID=4874 RepID=A0A8H3WXA6_GIGMA|nr:hypothetical protein F8M41_013174 [Gigaspora margarita]
MDSKLNIDIDTDTNTFDSSSRSNNISNQPNVIVISDTEDEPFINDHYRNNLIRILLKESTSNVVVCTGSFQSEDNSDNSLENNNTVYL